MKCSIEEYNSLREEAIRRDAIFNTNNLNVISVFFALIIGVVGVLIDNKTDSSLIMIMPVIGVLPLLLLAPLTEKSHDNLRQMVNLSSYIRVMKERESVCKDLRKVYTAPTEEAALERLDEFDSIWGLKYPMLKQRWLSKWPELSEFFKYPPEIRKLIYTTNSIEFLNSRLRKVTRNRATFPTDDSIYKVMYLALKNVENSWTRKLDCWQMALHHFSIMFPDRVPGNYL